MDFSVTRWFECRRSSIDLSTKRRKKLISVKRFLLTFQFMLFDLNHLGWIGSLHNSSAGGKVLVSVPPPPKPRIETEECKTKACCMWHVSNKELMAIPQDSISEPYSRCCELLMWVLSGVLLATTEAKRGDPIVCLRCHGRNIECAKQM